MSLTEADLAASNLYELQEEGRFSMILGGAISPCEFEQESREAGHKVHLEHLGSTALAEVLTTNPDN